MTTLPVIPSKNVGDDVLAADWNSYVQGMFAWLDANRPLTHVYQSVAQTVANNVFSAVTFTLETVDRRGQHSTTVNTSRITATADLGTYLVAGQVAWTTNATGTRRCRFTDSGVTPLQGAYGLYPPASAFGTAVAIGIWQPATSTAYIELEALQDSGGNLDTLVSANGIRSFAMAYRLGT